MAEASSQGGESRLAIRVDDKPGPVPSRRCRRSGGDHSSRRRVAVALEHSHPGTPLAPKNSHSGGPPSTVPLFKLAPGRACLAAGRPAVARGLLPHDFNLTGRGQDPRHTHRAEALRVLFGGVISVALSLGSPRVGVTDFPALWSPDFPPVDGDCPPAISCPPPTDKLGR